MVSGGILAGGKSTRFGQDKRNHVIGERTLLERTYDTLFTVTDRIRIANGAADVRLQKRKYELVADSRPDSGPLGGLFPLLKNSDSEWILVMACDLPLVRSETLLRLIAAISRDRIDANQPVEAVIARSRESGHIQPLLGCYSRDVGRLETDIYRTGRRSVKRVLDRLNGVDFVDLDDDELININSVEDLKGIGRKLESGLDR